MESSEADDMFAARLANLNVNQEVDYIEGADPKSLQVPGGLAMAPDLAKANSEQPKEKSKLDNYKILRDLGEGAYGQVSLAKEIETGKLVAIKEVDMEMIVKLQKERHILREKNLLD